MLKSKTTPVYVGGGVSTFSLLTVLFIGLKLAGIINWSWWWVLAPLWGPTALVLSVILVCLVITAILVRKV